jgi:hypothetical protein
MSTSKKENFEIVLNGETQIVITENLGNGSYSVLLQGRRVGTMFKRKPGKFACYHDTSGRQFGGRTRRDAATNMIFQMYRIS